MNKEKTQGMTYPAIRKLQGRALVPYNVRQVEIDDGNGGVLMAYEYGLLRHQPGPDTTDLETWKGVIWKLLQSDLHAHVYGTYDQGEQSTFLAYGARAMGEGRQDIVTECLSVQGWIDSVLVYYDQRKDAIFAATDEATLTGVVWDFAVDMPCDAWKDWRAVRAMFEG